MKISHSKPSHFAVLRQICDLIPALLVYVLLRFLAFAHGLHHSFTRIFTLIRSALWRRWDLASLLPSPVPCLMGWL